MLAILTALIDSYGGSVGSQAIGSLLSTIKSTASQDKDKASKMGKVLHLVYVAAIIPQVGETSAMLSELMIADNDNMDTLPLEFVDGKMFCKEEIKELFYGTSLLTPILIPSGLDTGLYIYPGISLLTTD